MSLARGNSSASRAWRTLSALRCAGCDPALSGPSKAKSTSLPVANCTAATRIRSRATESPSSLTMHEAIAVKRPYDPLAPPNSALWAAYEASNTKTRSVTG